MPINRSEAVGVTVMLHLSKHAERMPLLIRTYLPCLSTRNVELLFQVKHYEMDLCRGSCKNASIAPSNNSHGLRCRCVVEGAWPQMQHRNLADHATGDRHLLFAHGDMWLDLRALLASPWLQEGRTMVTPSHGLEPAKVDTDAETLDYDAREVHRGPSASMS